MASFPVETSDQRAVLGVAISFIILPVLAVCLRLIARRISRKGFDLSDYCVVIACIFAVGLQSVSITGVLRAGIGWGHVTDVVMTYGMEPLTLLFKLLIPLQFLWVLSLSFSKLSILLLYTKLFPVASLVWIARGTGIVIILWAFATILTGCLICQPFEMNWNPTLPGGKCGDQVTSFTVTGSINLVTDVIVLVLPMPHLYKLHMAMYKRVTLICVFGTGVVTCIISGLRISVLSTMDFENITYTIPLANIFSGLEPSVAVVLACIPLLRPLLGPSKYTPEQSGYLASESNNTGKADRHFQPLEDDSSQYNLRPMGPSHQAGVTSGRGGKPSTANSSDLDSEPTDGALDFRH
ncbi:hypothetical protein ACRALDRAFT_1069423 [Sodiomyces alcalophilus JCM 7366]|uniref:uncharacterized protein n=1 Tax=Sodiomyces alcalophilus JCM 7366 TaxID=591952 RepID=UPI0039B5A276